jgi:hypothetical protein
VAKVLSLAPQGNRVAVEQELRAKGFQIMSDGTYTRPVIGPDGKPSFETFDPKLLEERVDRLRARLSKK